jgi:hypothetical protein
MIARLKLVEPCHENRQVAAVQVIDARIMPIRQPNADLRSREYLTPALPRRPCFPEIFALPGRVGGNVPTGAVIRRWQW